jgi:hypothetical protein
MYTELEAVNYLLSQVGAAPVASLANPLPDVASAQLRLHEAGIWIQKTGWWFNRLLGQTLTPDEIDNEIDLPANTLKIISPWPAFLIARDDKVYNPYTDSYEFDAALTLDIVLLLDFEQLPASAQDAVLYRAAKEMVLHELEDHHKAERIELDVRLSHIQLKKEDLEIKQRNSFDTPRIQRFMSRVRPYKRYSGAYNPTYPGGGSV